MEERHDTSDDTILERAHRDGHDGKRVGGIQ